MSLMQYGSPAGQGPERIVNESASPLADGITYPTDFRFVPGTLCLWRNGSRLAPGVHFEELAAANGYKVIDTNGNPQAANTLMLADYLKA